MFKFLVLLMNDSCLSIHRTLDDAEVQKEWKEVGFMKSCVAVEESLKSVVTIGKRERHSEVENVWSSSQLEFQLVQPFHFHCHYQHLFQLDTSTEVLVPMFPKHVASTSSSAPTTHSSRFYLWDRLCRLLNQPQDRPHFFIIRFPNDWKITCLWKCLRR